MTMSAHATGMMSFGRSPPVWTPLATHTLVENTPIDYLDFASPVSGLGSKMGMDATNKWPGETDREWGEPIVMDDKVKQRVKRNLGFPRYRLKCELIATAAYVIRLAQLKS